MAGKDWFDWHRAYDDPASDLAGRLRAVQGQIAGALDRASPGPLRVVSVCAGQGRDLLEVLVDHPRRSDVRARLVELNLHNAAVASEAVRAAGLDGVEVVVGDASVTTVYDGAVPADLVLLCGVFGHATDDDIRSTIRHLPTLCARGGIVVWTRGGFHPDLRPTIRSWFVEEGFGEVAFQTGPRTGDTSGGHGPGSRHQSGRDAGDWGGGTNRLIVEAQPYELGIRLFTFLDQLPG